MPFQIQGYSDKPTMNEKIFEERTTFEFEYAQLFNSSNPPKQK